MELITFKDKRIVDAFADRLGTFIPGTTSVLLWPLPILELLAEKIEALELQVQELQEASRASPDPQEASRR